jgi:peroxiredoxin
MPRALSSCNPTECLRSSSNPSLEQKFRCQLKLTSDSDLAAKGHEGGTHKEMQMFFRSRRSLIAVTLPILLALSTVASVPRATTAAPAVQDFSLRTIDGRTITAEDVRGQVVVLAFGASWLPLSRKQAEGMRKLANEYAKQGVIVYFVATDSDSPKSKNYATDQQLRSFAERHNLNLTVLRDVDGQVFKQFGVDQIPAFVILDKQGNMVGTPIGGLDADGNVIGQLAPTLDKAL